MARISTPLPKEGTPVLLSKNSHYRFANRDPDPDKEKEREPFTSEVLFRHIVSFIVADDQVCILHCLVFIVILIVQVYQCCGMLRFPSTPTFSS